MGEPHCVVIDQLIALQKQVVRLAQQARTDTLTGLFNFQHFRLAIEQEMERTRRTGQATALIMIDLDHFKRVNDNWGHEVGNQVLIATAATLRQYTRRLDIPCRYGGEEFAAILPSTDLLTATQVAERVREAIESTPVVVDEHAIRLTASLGVAVYQSAESIDPKTFIEKADQSLYRAKDQGRNQVCYEEVLAESSDTAISPEEHDILSGFFGDSEDSKNPSDEH